MVVPPAPDHAPGLTNNATTDSPAEAGSRSATLRVVLVGVLVVALLASTVVLVWLLAGRRGQAEDLQQDREAAMAQAEQFMLRVNTYGPDQLDDQGQMPEYRELVKEIITPKFATSFEGGVTAAEQSVAQAGVARTAEVFATGVSSIDADSATALVAGSFTNSYPQGKSGDRVLDDPAPFRVEVTLVKSDGKWLVDNFSPVTGGSQ